MTRATDKGRAAAVWGRYGRDVVTAIAVGLAAWSVFGIQQESKERRHQSCLIFEAKQKSDVDALVRTYDYLAGLSAKELRDAVEPGEPGGLNGAVLANLPRTIRDAQTDDAPAYCDEPGIGLPEPDPVVPERPRSLPSP